MGNKYLVVFVHGTWGRGFFSNRDLYGFHESQSGFWFDQTEGLQRGIGSFESTNRTIEFRRFFWPGQNSINNRYAAASQLSEELTIIEAEYHCIVLIGHSHGGAVALKTLSFLSPHIIDKVHFITLATPFLSLHRISDDDWRKNKISHLTGIASVVLAALLSSFAAAFGVGQLNINASARLWQTGIALVLFALLVPVLDFLLRPIFKFFLSSKDASTSDIDTIIDRAELPHERIRRKSLIIRASADEAYAVFNVAILFSIISTLMIRFVRLAMTPLIVTVFLLSMIYSDQSVIIGILTSASFFVIFLLILMILGAIYDCDLAEHFAEDQHRRHAI